MERELGEGSCFGGGLALFTGVFLKKYKFDDFSISCEVIICKLEIQPPYGGFLIDTAEDSSLLLQQKGPLSQKVILPDRRADGRTDGWTDNGFKGVR